MRTQGRMKKAVLCSCLLVLVTIFSPSGAQDSACLGQLVPCLQYIHVKQAPPSSCCKPLHALIKSNPQCLCSMLGGNSATRQTGVNTTQAQLLPARCGEKVNAALCRSAPKTKGALSNVAGEVFLRRGAMVAVISVIAQAILWLIMS